MKIIADDKIPLVAELFGIHGQVIQKPGPLINARDLKDADILLVRTVTQVTRDLLSNSSVRFVGTATAGTDHIDCSWLNQTGIHWGNAKGANADAVVEYVLCCIAALQTHGKLSERPKVGIIGVGDIGSRLQQRLTSFGWPLLLNDPPRARMDAEFNSTPLHEFVDLDLICMHTPLTTSGEFATHHLIDFNFLKKLNPNCVLLNAGRGAVIAQEDLLKLKITPPYCFDVWENEPHINLEVLQRATIATPHIAGYSRQAKRRATLMLYQQIQPLFKLAEINWTTYLPPSALTVDLNHPNWHQTVLSAYDPLAETKHLQNALCNTQFVAETFEQLRRDYMLRDEFNFIQKF